MLNLWPWTNPFLGKERQAFQVCTSTTRGGGAQGGGASGSEMGGRTITSLGGSGSAIDCSTKTPRAKPFLVPSTVEPLLK